MTTNPATAITTTGATINGTNASSTAENTSFWVGPTFGGPFTFGTDPGSTQLPAGWSHDSGLGGVAASAPFSTALTGLTPNTPYYFVAWAQIGGYWYPGAVLSFTTADVPHTGTLQITKYMCPAETVVNRTTNGVEGSVPEGCVAETGATFGYVHGTQTDANSPFPELSGPLTEAGATNSSGVLAIENLDATGRYLVAETDGSGNQLPYPDSKLLGLYCQGDADTSGNNDNQEITFVPADGTAKCVAYDKAPVKTTLHVNIFKYIDGAIATSGSANGLSFPMQSSWTDDIDSGSGTYTLGPSGFSTSTPYVASTRTMDAPADYSTSETVDNSTVYGVNSESCPAGKFKFAGYKWGDSLSAAEAMQATTTIPAFKGLNADKYLIVENSACKAPVPSCNENASTTYVSDATTQENSHNSVLLSFIHPSWTAVITGAEKWIWGEDGVTDTVNQTSETFTRTFTIVGTPLDSTLTIAADNTYDVSVNGHAIHSDANEDNYSAAGQDVNIPVPSAYLLSGTNTITFTVTNLAMAGGTPTTNPAGLLYTLTVHNNECKVPPPQNSCPVPDTLGTATQVTVHNAPSNEQDLQVVLTNAGYTTTVATDQTGFQTWNVTAGQDVTVDATYITRMAGQQSVFGYYTDGDLSTFTPIFKSYNIPGYESVPLSTAGPVSFTIPNSGTVGFAIKAFKYDGTVLIGTRATQNSLNTGGNQQAVVFNPSSNEYILAFEDLINGDGDYNDLVVKVSLGCEATPQVVTTNVTMCKYDDSQHPLSGWTLTLKGAHVEDLSVPSNQMSGTTTSGSLSSGTSYLALASGTWQNSNLNAADAEYASVDSWATHMDGYNINPYLLGADEFDLQVNGGFVGWGAYNSSHGYAYSFTPGASGPANFRIFDGQGGVANADWYSDNSGSLNVSLYKGYAGITGENGCTTFENVPVGDYTVGEGSHDGWVNLSGLGPVAVSEENNHFDVINQQTNPNANTGILTIAKNTSASERDGTFDFSVEGSTATTTSISTVEGYGHVDITYAAGTSTITESSKDNWTLSGVSCMEAESEQSVYTDSVDGGVQVHIGNGEHVWCEFTNEYTGSEGGGGGKTTSAVTEYVHQGDLATSSSDVAANPTKWFFYNDSTDQIDNSIGGMVTGPAPAPLGIGSAEFTLAANPLDRKNVATYQFAGTKLDQITAMSYSAYSHSGVAGPNESPFFNFNVDLDGSDAWQYRLVYVPSANLGAVAQDAWNTFDVINGGNALWTWSHYAANGNQWPDGNTSEYRTWNDIKSQFPNARIRMTDPWLGIRVGEPGPTGYTGNVDNFVITIDDGSNATTTTVDFEPMVGTQTTITNATDLENNPTLIGQPFTVQWSVTPTSGSGTPTGTVTVTVNGGAGCSGDVADGSCQINPSGTGSVNLVATYGGSTGFSGSQSGTVSHLIVAPPSTSNAGGGGGGGGGGNGPVAGSIDTPRRGQVLGASTVAGGSEEGDGASCSALITQYMRQGMRNDPTQVKALQTFLNGEINAQLPVTGFFGSKTTAAVNAFQLKYWQTVLAPWVPYGLPTDHTPTGYVERTTSWMINMLFCPSLDLPAPLLP